MKEQPTLRRVVLKVIQIRPKKGKFHKVARPLQKVQAKASRKSLQSHQVVERMQKVTREAIRLATAIRRRRVKSLRVACLTQLKRTSS